MSKPDPKTVDSFSTVTYSLNENFNFSIDKVWSLVSKFEDMTMFGLKVTSTDGKKYEPGFTRHFNDPTGGKSAERIVSFSPNSFSYTYDVPYVAPKSPFNDTYISTVKLKKIDQDVTNVRWWGTMQVNSKAKDEKQKILNGIPIFFSGQIKKFLSAIDGNYPKNLSLREGYPTNVVAVGCDLNGKANFMAAAWHSYVSKFPPLYSVWVSPKRATFQGIMEKKQFNIGFLPDKHRKVMQKIGVSSGNDIDKVKTFSLTKNVKDGQNVSIKYLDLCYCTYECTLEKAIECGDHYLFLGKIVGVIKKDEYYKDGLFDVEKYGSVQYVGKYNYVTHDKKSKSVFSDDISKLNTGE